LKLRPELAVQICSTIIAGASFALEPDAKLRSEIKLLRTQFVIPEKAGTQGGRVLQLTP
jgi:hypothetical protein